MTVLTEVGRFENVRTMNQHRVVEHWVGSRECCDPAWEAAYARFETPEQEIAKFVRRLRGFGVETWNRDLTVVEIFCGRGSGLEAWRELGFRQLEGVDISESLLRQYRGEARLYLGDCRQLKFPDASRDVICVQGGLHHLPALPEDLRSTVEEVRRILKPGGRFVVVEPWPTPFLHLVHAACGQAWVRASSTKFEALSCMIEHERETYFNWLGKSREQWEVLSKGFQTETKRTSWGKLSWVGRKPAVTLPGAS
ncbi:MAG: class I SAM-dependent methyltransferase [Opitutaceae bacterium]